MTKITIDGICPNCGTSLTDNQEIDKEKTIHLVVSIMGREINIYFSSVLGSNKIKILPKGEKIQKGLRLTFICPKCKKQLPKFQKSCDCGGTIYRISDKISHSALFFCNTYGCGNQKMRKDQTQSKK